MWQLIWIPMAFWASNGAGANEGDWLDASPFPLDGLIMECRPLSTTIELLPRVGQLKSAFDTVAIPRPAPLVPEDGRFVYAGGSKGGLWGMTFHGDAAMLRQENVGWVGLADGLLLVAETAPHGTLDEQPAASSTLVALHRRVPKRNGTCTVTIAGVPSRFGGSDVAVEVPLHIGAPVTVRTVAHLEGFDSIHVRMPEHSTVSGQRPLVSSLADLLTFAQSPSTVLDAMNREDEDAIGDILLLGADRVQGTTVALASFDDGQLAMEVFGETSNARRMARRMTTRLAELGWPTRKGKRGSFEVETPEGRMWLAATDRGTMVVATNVELMRELRDQTGQPWFSAEDRLLARQHGLIRVDHRRPKPTGAPALFGLSRRGGFWEMVIPDRDGTFKSGAFAGFGRVSLEDP